MSSNTSLFTPAFCYGAAILADADSDRILEATDKLIGQKPKSTNHFGDGHASEIIVKKIIHSLER